MSIANGFAGGFAGSRTFFPEETRSGLPDFRPRDEIEDFVAVIARQCERQPDKVAVSAPDRRLTYSDLAARVSRLSGILHESGADANSVVGICMPRGADELTAMLAVLSVGAAYVPLDPAQPANRLSMIVTDAEPALIITDRSVPFLAGNQSTPSVIITGTSLATDCGQKAVWEPVADPDALAYVLFTSGSTGRPKGVEIPRSAVSNLLASMVRTPGIGESDVLLAVSTTMFDIAVLELFGPLCVGGTVRIVDSDVTKDGRRLREVLEREPISVMQATPTMWHMLIDSGWVGDGHLRMLVGGEALSPDLAGRLLPSGELWNMYGPTETTVWSTCRRIERRDDITIGHPIANTSLHVLDAAGHSAAPGDSGELCIGGAGLARGYLGRPDLTAERFIPNPVSPSRERIYRTGDLVRIRHDGEYEYLGRTDHQVKIRGFRIELGEIEHALCELETVNRAVVTTWERDGGSPMLVAYVVPHPGSGVEPSELSRLLRERLPSYMVPGRYIGLTEFPLTINRKIDRGALPDPGDVPQIPGHGPRTGPRNDTERALVGIWSEVLKKKNIAIDDDFFDLDGQSVLAVAICDRIHRQLGVDLPVSALVDRRTVRELASHVEDLRSGVTSQEWSSVVPIQPDGSQPPIFCVSGIGGNPMNFVELAAALGRQQPFFGLQYRGVDGRSRPSESIEEMAHDFLADIRAVQKTGPYILAGYSGGGLAAYEMARQLCLSGEDVPLLIFFDTVRPGLAGWSNSERAQSHWVNLRNGGVRYLARRVADRTAASLDETGRRLRASLAGLWPYRFRLDAVERAGRRAQTAYRPPHYRGDVLLFQSDSTDGSAAHVPVRQHEANGWRELITGELEVVPVAASHFGILDGAAGQFVAAEIRRALTAPRERTSIPGSDHGSDADGQPPVGVAAERVCPDGPGKWEQCVRRTSDLTIALLALLILAPLMLIIAATIKADSPGPVLFRQRRIGLNREPFQFFKFRTMHVGSDDAPLRESISREMSGENLSVDGSWKLADDKRITAIGAILRRWSLDELPQLVNVVLGNMSVVGPRPCLEWEAELFAPEFSERFSVKPGLTGLWQVSGRSTMGTREMLALDVRYARERTFLGDIGILAKTVPAVLRVDGAR